MARPLRSTPSAALIAPHRGLRPGLAASSPTRPVLADEHLRVRRPVPHADGLAAARASSVAASTTSSLDLLGRGRAPRRTQAAPQRHGRSPSR